MSDYEEKEENGAWHFRMRGYVSWLPGRAPTPAVLQQEALDEKRRIEQLRILHSCPGAHHGESSDGSALVAGAVGLAIGYALGDDEI